MCICTPEIVCVCMCVCVCVYVCEYLLKKLEKSQNLPILNLPLLWRNHKRHRI